MIDCLYTCSKQIIVYYIILLPVLVGIAFANVNLFGRYEKQFMNGYDSLLYSIISVQYPFDS